ncbi:hypothetical protein [Nostoc sp.]|uniref:hypothetical protein n=1 Tax=Nostoc sp. TaxID=1180 RepID=UPI002FFA7746
MHTLRGFQQSVISYQSPVESPTFISEQRRLGFKSPNEALITVHFNYEQLELKVS